MCLEMTVDRIEKTEKGYVLTGECGEKLISICVNSLCGAKEGDIVSIDGEKLTVLEEKTKKRREYIAELQRELFD